MDVDATYRRYAPMVFRRCLQLLANEAKAADAMQDVFVQLLRHRQALRGNTPSALLNRMATNVCLNLLKRHGPSGLGEDDPLWVIAQSGPMEQINSIFQQNLNAVPEPFQRMSEEVLHGWFTESYMMSWNNKNMKVP